MNSLIESSPLLPPAIGRRFGFARRAIGVLLVVCSAALPAPAAAEPTAPSSALSIPFEKYTLDNGLEVILHSDPTVPLVAVNLWYHVGPANEPVGRSGFAHLFEHLMFEGSKYVGPRFDTLLESAGASNVNGTTSWDRTNYFETVPSQHLEMVLWIESDRMGFMLDTLSQERLEVQRAVVKNERRQSYENRPYGPSALALYDALYPEGHPYHGAVIGSMADLDRASADDVRKFFVDYYAPSNATLAIAGSFETAKTKQWIEKYFGPLPKKPRPPRGTLSTPPLPAPIRLEVPEPVEVAQVTFAWLTPPAYHPDEAALEVALTILATGKASRLYQDLVVKQKLATQISGYLDSNQVTSAVNLDALVASGVPPAKVEQALEGAVARLARTGPTAEELSRAKRRLEVMLLSSLELLNGPGGESGRAGTLQRLNHYLGDPGKLPELWQKTLAVSADDVKRVVTQYLDPKARASVVTEPKTAPPAVVSDASNAGGGAR